MARGGSTPLITGRWAIERAVKFVVDVALDNVYISAISEDLTISVSQVRLSCTTAPEVIYHLQYRTDVGGDGSLQTVLDSVAQDQPRRYYRLTRSPPYGGLRDNTIPPESSLQHVSSKE